MVTTFHTQYSSLKARQNNASRGWISSVPNTHECTRLIRSKLFYLINLIIATFAVIT